MRVQTCVPKLACPNLRAQTCANKLARPNLRAQTCANKLARTNLRMPTLPAPTCTRQLLVCPAIYDAAELVIHIYNPAGLLHASMTLIDIHTNPCPGRTVPGSMTPLDVNNVYVFKRANRVHLKLGFFCAPKCWPQFLADAIFSEMYAWTRNKCSVRFGSESSSISAVKFLSNVQTQHCLVFYFQK